jgi:NAD(P)H-hydrate repair Nnr-like enzyme with NAD(P)H-hydrate dehydratase domain
LNALASDAALVPLLRARVGRGLATVLTPHPLEAARLLGCATVEVQADRLHAAQTLADRLGAVVVLKGSGSVIAAPGNTPRINATGNASLATAGTGDVLAGWLGGRWAQRDANDAATAFTTAVQAVAEHGSAAEPPPSGALRAGDLIERLHAR